MVDILYGTTLDHTGERVHVRSDKKLAVYTRSAYNNDLKEEVWETPEWVYRFIMQLIAENQELEYELENSVNE